MDVMASERPTLDDDDVFERWNRNLADYVELLAEAAPGGEWHERDGIVLFVGAHPYPGTHTNGLLRLTAELPAADALAAADELFARKRRSYTVWIRDDHDADLEAAVRERGFAPHPPEAGMPAFVLDPAALHAPPSSDESAATRDCVVRAVDDARTAVDCLKVTGAAFGMDVTGDVLAKIFFHPRVLLDDRVDAFVGYVDGAPMACCQSFSASGFAGIYSAATVPAARGRGLGRLTATAAARAGLERGAVYVGGTSSDLGMPMWNALGCRVLGRWRRYYGRAPSPSPS